LSFEVSNALIKLLGNQLLQFILGNKKGVCQAQKKDISTKDFINYNDLSLGSSEEL